MPTKTATSQLILASARARRLTEEARALLTSVGLIDHDSARLGSALGLLSTATGLLADATGELHQAGVVAGRIAQG